MKLSTKVRYAARALAMLGEAYPDGIVSVREIADNQSISAKYLERLFGVMRRAGLVRAVRGLGGGYVLAKPPEAITLEALYTCFDGPIALVHCVNDPKSCPLRDVCPTCETWGDLQEAMLRILRQTTVRDLADRRSRTRDSSTVTLHI